MKNTFHLKLVRNIFSFAVLLILFSNIVAQEKPSSATEASNLKAQAILNQSRKAISLKRNISEISEIAITINSAGQFDTNGKKAQFTTETELGVELPNKIKKKEFIDYQTNQTNEHSVLNGEAFSKKLDAISNGRVMNINLQSNQNKETQKQNNISQLKSQVFTSIFPIILNTSFYEPLEFNYIGIAESKDGKADVIETTAASGTKYQLFFDQQTNLLLMMTQSWTGKTSGKKYEKKYFYSDYREVDGLNAPHKIVVQQDGAVIEESQLKTLKVNPKFTADFFEVKEP